MNQYLKLHHYTTTTTITTEVTIVIFCILDMFVLLKLLTLNFCEIKLSCCFILLVVLALSTTLITFSRTASVVRS